MPGAWALQRIVSGAVTSNSDAKRERDTIMWWSCRAKPTRLRCTPMLGWSIASHRPCAKHDVRIGCVENEKCGAILSLGGNRPFGRACAEPLPGRVQALHVTIDHVTGNAYRIFISVTGNAQPRGYPAK